MNKCPSKRQKRRRHTQGRPRQRLEGWDHSQGLPAAGRSWKRQEGSSLRVPRGSPALPTPSLRASGPQNYARVHLPCVQPLVGSILLGQPHETKPPSMGKLVSAIPTLLLLLSPLAAPASGANSQRDWRRAAAVPHTMPCPTLRHFDGKDDMESTFRKKVPMGHIVAPTTEDGPSLTHPAPQRYRLHL